MYKIGMHVRIKEMRDEPGYAGKVGLIESIDDLGQLHGTWGGLAIVPEVDDFIAWEESRV